MQVKCIIGTTIVNILFIYAPQIACEYSEKEKFCQDLDTAWSEIPNEEGTIIGGDFDGHSGTNYEPTSGVHGGFGSGHRSMEEKE